MKYSEVIINEKSKTIHPKRQCCSTELIKFIEENRYFFLFIIKHDKIGIATENITCYNYFNLAEEITMNIVVKESKLIIENNLHGKLSLNTIASQLGYSQFHFSKLFKKYTGLTVHQYINDRKLICASKDILKGERIINVAMNYGYETQSGFNKAFVKKFGYPPNMLYAMRLIKELFSAEGGIHMNHEQLHTNLKNELLKTYTAESLVKFDKAYTLVYESIKDKKRYSGDPYIVHQLWVATILEKMDLPLDTIILGLLHEVYSPDTSITEENIINDFGKEIHTKIIRLENMVLKENNISQLLNDYSDDIILVKLADRLHNMKTLKHLSPTRWKEKASETMKLFIPLAEAIGLESLKMELEHLSLEYL